MGGAQIFREQRPELSHEPRLSCEGRWIHNDRPNSLGIIEVTRDKDGAFTVSCDEPTFFNGLRLHDAGGRIKVEGTDVDGQLRAGSLHWSNGKSWYPWNVLQG